MAKRKQTKENLYLNNKKAKVGTPIICPICHGRFTKKQYSQAFCCTHCKDAYHNMNDEDRHLDPNYYDNYDRTHFRDPFFSGEWKSDDDDYRECDEWED